MNLFVVSPLDLWEHISITRPETLFKGRLRPWWTKLYCPCYEDSWTYTE